ncbi:energy-coupling factor ABC transporter ATP-binding protein [Desulfococcus sp.]|uniref:energy-coupling factor ABC transporter ATP-binding protein n=1 Tax=Desulfococcus sp. TaxID=2025834 RepID=UPI003D12FA62
MAAPIFDITALRHAYAGKTVLEIPQLSIQPGAVVGLIGPNGSGKSTLLKLLGLIQKPTEGEIRFCGRVVEPFSPEARFSITLVPQEPFLMRRSVFDNVAYGLRLRGDAKNLAERVHEALSLVGLRGEDFVRRPWYALSGGETQRVALAARLALRPRVLLLDEPTASVDSASAQRIKEASVQACRELGTTLVAASHDWQWLLEICDHMVHLFKGRISGSGRETLLFGPWQSLGSGKWGKILPDDRRVPVPEPPSPEAVAVIEAMPLDEADPGPGDADIALAGIVSRLSLEKKTGEVVATVLVGDLPFTVRITPGRYDTGAIFPGNTLHIQYRIDQIRWL